MVIQIKRTLSGIGNVIKVVSETPHGGYDAGSELCIDVQGQEAKIIDSDDIVHIAFFLNHNERAYNDFLKIVNRIITENASTRVSSPAMATKPVVTFYINERVITGITITCGAINAGLIL